MGHNYIMVRLWDSNISKIYEIHEHNERERESGMMPLISPCPHVLLWSVMGPKLTGTDINISEPLYIVELSYDAYFRV
jgi:hypothetical protein